MPPHTSCAPLLAGDGHLIGVVTSTLNGMVLAVATGAVPQNVNFAVKVAIVRNFLDSHDITYAHAASARELPAADVGDLARKFTVRIECGG
jgi:uncharacterized protein